MLCKFLFDHSALEIYVLSSEKPEGYKFRAMSSEKPTAIKSSESARLHLRMS